MSFAGKLARGVLQGMSGYYGEIARQQAEERKIQLLADKERALAQFNAERRKEEIAATGEETRKTYQSKVIADVAGESALTPIKADAQIKVNSAKESAEFETFRKKLPLETQKDLTIERFRQMSQTQREMLVQGRIDARQEDSQAFDRDNKPIMTVENEAGEPTAVFADGARRRTLTARGGRQLGTKTKGEAGEEDSILGNRPDRIAPPSGKPADAEADPRFQELLNESFSHPTTKDLSATERKAKVKEMAERLGIPVPQGY